MKLNTHRKPHTSRAGGFSRVDLVTVLATVTFLFVLATSMHGNSGRQSRAAICIGNLARLNQAWTLYADDHEGKLVVNLSGNVSAGHNWAHGSISFGNSTDNTNTINLVGNLATLGPYTRDALLYRCPSDESQIATASRPSKILPRVRSYTMSYFVGNSDISSFATPNYRSYLYMSDIVAPKPADLMVFVDTHPDSINNPQFKINPTIGRNARMVDFPAYWHNGGGTLSFADGHVETHRWEDSRSTPRISYLGLMPLNVESPNNPDVQWISEHSTSPRNN